MALFLGIYIPLEVLTMIIEPLDRQDFSALTLVSRELRKSFEPFLYRTIRWSNEILQKRDQLWPDAFHREFEIDFILIRGDEELMRALPPVDLLVRTFLVRPELACHVSSLILHICINDAREPSPSIFWPMNSIIFTPKEIALSRKLVQEQGSDENQDEWIHAIERGEYDAILAMLWCQIRQLRFLDFVFRHSDSKFKEYSVIIAHPERSEMEKSVPGASVLRRFGSEYPDNETLTVSRLQSLQTVHWHCYDAVSFWESNSWGLDDLLMWLLAPDLRSLEIEVRQGPMTSLSLPLGRPNNVLMTSLILRRTYIIGKSLGLILDVLPNLEILELHLTIELDRSSVPQHGFDFTELSIALGKTRKCLKRLVITTDFTQWELGADYDIYFNVDPNPRPFPFLVLSPFQDMERQFPISGTLDLSALDKCTLQFLQVSWLALVGFCGPREDIQLHNVLPPRVGRLVLTDDLMWCHGSGWEPYFTYTEDRNSRSRDEPSFESWYQAMELKSYIERERKQNLILKSIKLVFHDERPRYNFDGIRALCESSGIIFDVQAFPYSCVYEESEPRV